MRPATRTQGDLNMRRSAVPLALLGSVLLGFIGEWLFFEAEPGLNVPLWTGLVGSVSVLLLRRQGLAVGRAQQVLLLVAWLFTWSLAWRDGSGLHGLSLLASALLLGMALYPWSSSPSGGRLREYALLMPMHMGLGMLTGLPALLLQGIEQQGGAREGLRARALRILMGLGLALPFLLLLGALFASADPVYRRLMQHLLDPEDLLPRLMLIVLLSGAAAGFWRLLSGFRLPALSVAFALPRLGALEVGVALGLIAGLLSSFVFVQIRYLFGGASLVALTPGLTYAAYAREGFGQLVAASAVALPMLLAFHALLDRRRREGLRLFRILAGLLIGLILIIMASAGYRLWLYQQAYGLTEARFYGAAFLLWLGWTLLWFAITVLAVQREERFAFGSAVAFLLLVVLLHGLNPDARIADLNIRRALEGKPLDTAYMASLSADALPTVLSLLNRLPEPTRAELLEHLRRHPVRAGIRSWREWNGSRMRARAELERLFGQGKA
jgi:hypothetical protein